MKKTIIALAVLATGVSAFAQDASRSADLSVTVDITYVNNYVFRGGLLAEDSIQPSVEAAYGDFYAGVWYSDDVNSAASSETDLYIGYNLAINEIFTADLGATRYLYDGQSGADTTEVYAGIKANVDLSPSVYYYYDFDRNVSSYIGSVGYSVPVEKVGVSVDLSATYGYIQIPATDYSYWGFGAAVPYRLSENATLTVAVNYTHADSRNLPAVAGFTSNDQDQVVFSVGLSVGF
jgi:uncharacterized protein (TIGR02001 family)